MNIQILDLANPLWQQTLQDLNHDFYHLPEYVALEARRANAIAEAILITDNHKLFFLPYLIRSCNELFESFTSLEVFDVISPYGYPGILLNKAAKTPQFINTAIQELTNILRERRICSAFFRLHPILNDDLTDISPEQFTTVGETVSVNLILSEAEIWSETRPEHRTKINKVKRAGFTAKMVPLEDSIDDFIEVYEETMDRVNASESYYFHRDYFLDLMNGLREKLHLCIVELNAQIACAGLFTECCGIVQYHLGGTKTEFLRQAPSKLMFDYVRYWAKERGNRVLHLGGGVGGSNDSLFHFKAGFSRQRHPFLTLRLVPDQAQYLELVNERAKACNLAPECLLKSSFFPAYRSLG